MMNKPLGWRSVPRYSQFLDVSFKKWKNKSCGIVAVKMLLDFWGVKNMSFSALIQEGLRQKGYIPGTGWKHKTLSDLAKKFGLAGKNYDWAKKSKSESFKKLKKELSKYPLIASIHKNFKPGASGHLAVLTGINKNTVYYNDPIAKDRKNISRSVPLKKFLAGWKQRAIIIYPKKRRIAILGFGREGKSVFKFLRHSAEYRGTEIWILDKSEKIETRKNIPTSLGKDYLKNLPSFDLVFRSPGIPYNLPELKKARGAGVKFSSATKLFFEHSKVPIIGVTGTKGKGTTSTLLYKILKAAKKDVYLAGNIGLPAIDVLPKLKKNSIVILELSSFQLQDLECSPKIAVVLEVFPDHREDIKTAKHGTHRSLREYYAAKGNISRHQTETDAVFFFGNQKNSRVIGFLGRAKKIAVNPQEFIEFDPAELKIRGAHNFRNAVMATLVAESLGVPKKIIVRTVKNFRGLEHRSKLVRKIGSVAFYNDSASTNPQTSSAAIRVFRGELFSVILGGYDKGLNYIPVAKAIKESKPRLVVLLGANAKKIYKTINRTGAAVKFAKNLSSAVKMAYLAAAKGKSRTVRSVVFSPGAASFDMFKNYADRGKQFKKIVGRL